MATLSADQLVDASAKAKLEVRAVAEKLAVARANENKANQENNSLRSQVEDLSKQVDELVSAQIQIDRAHAGEVATLKSALADLSGAREEAAKAAKALAPETARADKAEAALADYKAEFDGVVKENKRLARDNDSVNKRLTAFVEAVKNI